MYPNEQLTNEKNRFWLRITVIYLQQNERFLVFDCGKPTGRTFYVDNGACNWI